MFARLSTVVVLSLCAALTVSPAGAGDIPEIAFEFYTLENGLEVILHEDHSTPIVGVNVWYHVGSKNERVGRSGFAHLFEHMMFQGSEHQDAEYFGPLQSIGADMNGSTSEDRTNYWEVVPSNHLERALLMEADRMGWLVPAMTQEKLENQQEVVRNERRTWEGNPYYIYYLKMNEHLYPKGHPYDRSVMGNHEDLANATLDDVKDFFRQYYVPGNATLSIAGDFDLEQTKEWIAGYFGEIPPGNPVHEVTTWVPTLTHEKRFVLQDRVQLTRRFYTWHTPPAFDEEEAPLDIAAAVLGGGRTSRLYRKLVHETKLAQSVSVSHDGMQVSSQFSIDVMMAPGTDPDRVDEIIDAELALYAEKGPTADELQRVKNRYEASFVRGAQRIGSFGGINDRLNRYNHYLGTPDYFQQDYQRYMDVTALTSRDSFRRWIGPGRVVATVEPFAEGRAVEVAGVDRETLPAGADMPAFSVPEATRRTLENGLELLVLEHHELPLVRMDLVFATGAAADPQDRAGLADVAASMILEGTKKYDKFEFQNELDFLGTHMNAWAEMDRSVVSVQTLEKHLDRSLELLSAALTTPALPESEFNDAKKRRLVNIGRENESPRTLARKVGRKVIFGAGHPYGKLSGGNTETMTAIELADVRGHLNSHFVPGNATLIAVGDITIDDLEKRVTKALGDWKGEAPPAQELPVPQQRTERAVYLVDKPGDAQSTISILQLGMPRNDPQWVDRYLANRVLGGYFSSRMNLNLREDKGYTYGVFSGTSQNVGVAAFHAGGRVQTEVTAAAITELMNEMEGIIGDRPITAEELEMGRNSVLLGYPGDFETVNQLAGALNDQVVYGLPADELVRYPERLAAATLDEVNEAARGYFQPQHVAVVVVGDLEKIEDSIRELKLGPVHHLDREGNPINAELSSR